MCGNAAGTRNGPVFKVTESRRREPQQGFHFEPDRMSSKHDTRAKKNVLLLAQYHVLCHEVEEVFSFADLDILTLVCPT